MVLKTTTTAKFEDDDAPDQTPAPAAPAAAEPTQEPKAGAAVVSLPTVQAKTTALAKPAKLNMADHDLLAGLENRLPPVGFGEGVRLVGNAGNLLDGDKKVLGDTIKILLLSWNMRWVVSPGTESDDKDSKTLARYSTDGENTTQGEPMQAYLQKLKDDGYDKAAIKEYLDLFGVLTYAAKDTNHIDEPVTVALSPSSAKGFLALRRSIVVKGLTGKLPPMDIEMGLPLKITTEIKSSGKLTWTQLQCELDAEVEKKAA